MRNRYLYILALVIPIMWIGCTNKEKSHKDLAKVLSGMAANLNSDAPIQFDEHTVFIGAEVDANNTFKYLYKIINVEDAKTMMNDVEIQTRARIRDAFAGDDKLKIFTDNKVYIDYIYTDESGDTLRVIHITPEDYKK